MASDFLKTPTNKLMNFLFELVNIGSEAVCIDVGNHFHLMLCDNINYNIVISAADLYESVKIYVSLMYKLQKILLSNMSRLETLGMALVLARMRLLRACCFLC